VAAGRTARRHTIRLGLRTASDIEVVEGLATGDLVLADGQYAFPDDAPIEPRSASD